MCRRIKAGTTDVSVRIRIVDSGDGTPETAVVWNTSGIDMAYHREGEADVAITEATLAALTTAHTDGGFLHIDDGYYRLDLPDAACAAGVTDVLVHGTVTGMVVIGCEIELVAYDPYDTVRLGLTALPNVASGSAGAVIVSGTGTAALSVASGLVTLAGVTHTGAVIPTVTTTTTATNVTTVNGLASAVITASSIATDAFGALELAADAVAEIADAVWDEARSGHTASGSFGSAGQVLDEGTLAAIGSTTQVTLAASAPAEADVFIGAVIHFKTSSTGALQSRAITAYTSGRVATLDRALSPALTGATTYIAYQSALSASDASIAAAVWDLARAGHATVGTFGELIPNLDAATSTLATPADVNTQADLALADIGATSTNFTKIAALPSATAGTNGGLPTVNGSNYIAGLQGTLNTLDALDTAQDVEHDATQAALLVVDDLLDTEIPALTTNLATANTKLAFLPSVTAGAAGGVFIAGSNAATSITTALTANVIGNITGNLSGSVGSVTGAVGSVTGAVGSVTGAVGSVTGTVGGIAGTITTLDALDTAQDTQHATTQGYVDDIGAAGAGLTAIPWNAAWDAEVQSEATDALVAYDPPTQAEMTTAVSAVETDTQDIQSRLPAALTGAGNIKADALVVTGVVASVTTVTGNVNGSVGSVTGAVGSVTGAVGSVTGSVASVSGAVGSVTGNVGGNVVGTVASVVTKTGYALASDGLDLVLVESGISASASLTNDAGTQLTSINARQALALVIAGDSGVLAGAATTAVTIKPSGLPAGNTRLAGTVDSNGNRSAVTIKVPT